MEPRSQQESLGVGVLLENVLHPLTARVVDSPSVLVFYITIAAPGQGPAGDWNTIDLNVCAHVPKSTSAEKIRRKKYFVAVAPPKGLRRNIMQNGSRGDDADICGATELRGCSCRCRCNCRNMSQ